MIKDRLFGKPVNEELVRVILETVKTEKPETTAQLVRLVQAKTGVSSEEITSLLIQLENEELIHFTKKEKSLPLKPHAYVFSKKALWYWVTIALAIVTTITVFMVPDDAYPVVYVRSAIGVIFVLFLPGYAIVKALFPIESPIKQNDANMETIERVALSLGVSLALVPLIGLILNYTPWGIRLIPITLSLLGLTVAFATAGVLREFYVKSSKS